MTLGRTLRRIKMVARNHQSCVGFVVVIVVVIDLFNIYRLPITTTITTTTFVEAAISGTVDI
jgi:hypothetical protein